MEVWWLGLLYVRWVVSGLSRVSVIAAVSLNRVEPCLPGASVRVGKPERPKTLLRISQVAVLMLERKDFKPGGGNLYKPQAVADTKTVENALKAAMSKPADTKTLNAQHEVAFRRPVAGTTKTASGKGPCKKKPKSIVPNAMRARPS